MYLCVKNFCPNFFNNEIFTNYSNTNFIVSQVCIMYYYAIMLSVIQTMDYLISLSVLWKALTNKQDLVEKLHYVGTNTEIVIMAKLQGTWVLAVVKVVLDVALSVAASVILSLLLIAGDVEENPGPVGGIFFKNSIIGIRITILVISCRPQLHEY